MNRRPSLLLSLVLALLVGVLAVTPSRAQTVDPAARGLDLFADAPDRAPSGDRVVIPIRTFGFVSATSAKPLGKVTVDAEWEGAKVDDKPITVESDANGLALLTVGMPEGAPGPAVLNLALRFGEHRRTREIQIEREPPYQLTMSVPSTEVSPGGSTTAWVRLIDQRTDRPVAGKRVQLSLREGGVDVVSRTVTTDASGSATSELPIPKVEQSSFSWQLVASAVDLVAGQATENLSASQATPALASISARAPASKLRLGTRALFRVNVADAAGEPISRVPVHALFLRDGENVPEGKLPNGKSAFESAAKRFETNEKGEIEVPYDAPPTIVRSQSIHLVARATLEGRERTATSDTLTIETRGTGRVGLTAEDQSLVPGLEQSLFVEVKDGFGEPVKTGVKLEGDGLSARATTDDQGFATVSWKVPTNVGSHRGVGPCSGDVATSVKVTLDEAAPKELRAGGPLLQCIPVERERRVIVRSAARVARAGDTVELEVLVASPGKAGLGPVAVNLDGSAAWLVDRDSPSADVTRFRGKISMPEGNGGVLPVRAVVLRDSAPSLLGVMSLLQKPRVMPKVALAITGGRSVPGGTVTVEAKLSDEQGGRLVGSVAAMVVDASTGDYEDAFTKFDTRRRLCSSVDVGAAGCDAVLAGGASTRVLQHLASASRGPKPPDLDPGRTQSSEMTASFTALLKSLEGGVFEASVSPDRVRDVLRMSPKGASFNPELFTVVTQAMNITPLTPGGEPMSLADLVAVDPQVDFDHVARRVARLKLFRLLVEARSFRHANNLDADEPALKDPNALLRRWKDDGKEDTLYDPWGRSFAFVASKGKAAKPFLSPIPGFDLVSPGPDGRLGTADDIDDPFARVVTAGSPYALAMGEERIADAWLDMRVADSSIASWKELMDKHTGTKLGDGAGFGSGSGRLGGSHRSKPASVRMGATSVTRPVPHYVWRAPVRTDASGVARIDVPLGGDETTYRIIVLGMPDSAGTAVATTDVKVALPLSVRVFAGDRITQGDETDVVVTVTNRTERAIRGELTLAAISGGALKKGEPAKRQIDVAPGKKLRVVVAVVATGRGKLALRADVSGGGQSDSVQHELPIDPPGRVLSLGRSRFVLASSMIQTFGSDARTSFEGPPSLVVESGAMPALLAALSSRPIETAKTSADAAEAIELYDRVRRYGEAMGPSGDTIRERAKIMGQRATGRYLATVVGDDAHRSYAAQKRALRTSPIASLISEEAGEPCPPEGTVSERALWDLIENEPSPVGGTVDTCWDAQAQAAMSRASSSKDVVAMARIVLAFAERDHRRSLAASLAGVLEREAHLTASGSITLDGKAGKEAKVIVYAALLRARGAGWIRTASADLLLGWLSVQRESDGGYGTTRASRAALQAIVAAKPSARPGSLRITMFDAEGDSLGERSLKIDDSGGGRTELAANTASVRVDTDTPVLVRLERLTLKKYRLEAAPQTTAAPVTVALRYPSGLRAGGAGSLEVAVRGEPGARRSFIVRVPLPPGVTVAEAVSGVEAMPGLILIKVDTDDAGIAVPSLVPLRFSLGGNFLAPPAEITDLDDVSIKETSTAARIVVARAP